MESIQIVATSYGEISQWFAAGGSPKLIEAFVAAGGVFTDQPNQHGATAAMIAARDLSTIRAYVRAGGRFSDQQDDEGKTAAMNAACAGSEAIGVFVGAGGTFTDQQDYRAWTAIEYAYLAGPEALAAYGSAVERQGGLRRTPMRSVATSSEEPKSTLAIGPM